MKKRLEQLMELAASSGATETRCISPDRLVIEDKIPGYCTDPGCPNYGKSPSCPPHVQGPDAFRKWRDESIQAVVIRIDVPTAVLHSDERDEVMKLLHEIVAKIESDSVALGFGRSKGFAGGSCKQLFCSEHEQCLFLSEERCRNPQHARPSMSGFGVNVGKMMESAGWSKNLLGEKNHFDEPASWVAGLVLVRE